MVEFDDQGLAGQVGFTERCVLEMEEECVWKLESSLQALNGKTGPVKEWAKSKLGGEGGRQLALCNQRVRR